MTAGHWLFLIDASSGKILYHVAFSGGLFGTLAIYHDRLMFGCTDGRVYAFG